MASLNDLALIGRLTRDPELKYTTGGDAYANFSIAVDKKFKKEGKPTADFFRCTAWRKTAEFIDKHARKGCLVYVKGAVSLNEYTKQDCTNGASLEVDCQVFEMLIWPDKGEGPQDEERQAPPPRGAAARSTTAPAPAKPEEFDDEDPFADQ